MASKNIQQADLKFLFLWVIIFLLIVVSFNFMMNQSNHIVKRPKLPLKPLHKQAVLTDTTTITTTTSTTTTSTTTTSTTTTSTTRKVLKEFEDIKIDHLPDIKESLARKIKVTWWINNKNNSTRQNQSSNNDSIIHIFRTVDCNQSKETETRYNLPKDLHFVWLSKNRSYRGAPIPDDTLWSVGSFCKMNPDYLVHLWVDRFIKFNSNIVIEVYFRIIGCQNFILHFMQEEEIINKRLYKKLLNVAARSDILRYEIIYKFGGIYLDTDSVAIKPFSESSTLFEESFVSYNPEAYHNICNCIFGFPKGSKFLKYLIHCMNENYDHDRKKDKHSDGTHLDFVYTGPDFMTACFLKYNDSRVNMIHMNYLQLYNQPNVMYQKFKGSWLNRN